MNIRISTIDELKDRFEGQVVGRPGFEPGIPWSLASEQESARPKPGIIAKLDHRPMLDGQSSDFGYKNNGVSLNVIMNEAVIT